MIDRFFDALSTGASPRFAAVSLIMVGLLALHLLFRRADLRALRSTRSNDSADLRAALNELASAAHELHLTSRRVTGRLPAADVDTVASLRRTAIALSVVSADIKMRVPFMSPQPDAATVAALGKRGKTSRL
jgi:hypothetical protein